MKENNQIIGQLAEWAHQGTEESTQRIQSVIDDPETSAEMRRTAEMALQEACFLNSVPENDIEQRDYDLCELIARRENRLYDLVQKCEQAEHDYRQTELAKEIHERLMEKTMDAARREDWSMHLSEDAMCMERYELEALQNDVEYYEAWIGEAKKSITTPKYQNLPLGFFSDFDDDEDDEDVEEIF